MPNNLSFMKYPLKSVPGLADVGVLHGDGDGPRTPPRCLKRFEKSFKWLILLCLTIVIQWNMLLNQSLALLMLGSPMGLGMAPELHPDDWGVRKKFKMTNFTMPNNTSSMKYALKSVPGIADVGVPHGDGDGPRTPPRWLEGVWKKSKWLIFLCLTIPLLWNML